MFWRCVQLLVVLAWMGSTALLVHKSYFPELSRFPKVENARVAEIYFDKGHTSDLLLVMPRKGAVGRLTVTPRRQSVRLSEAALQKAAGEVFFTGRFDPEGLPLAPAGEIVWNGSLFLNQELGSEGLSLQVRLPKLNLTGQVMLEGTPPRVAYQLKQGTVVLADSRQPAKGGELLSQMALAGKLAGMDMPSADAVKEWPSLLQSLAPQIVCRHGQFRILDRRFDGYVVHLKWSTDAQVWMLVTEMGELLRIQGIPQMEVLAESFVPEEMMEPEEGVDDP